MVYDYKIVSYDFNENIFTKCIQFFFITKFIRIDWKKPLLFKTQLIHRIQTTSI